MIKRGEQDLPGTVMSEEEEVDILYRGKQIF